MNSINAETVANLLLKTVITIKCKRGLCIYVSAIVWLWNTIIILLQHNLCTLIMIFRMLYQTLYFLFN